MRLPGMKSTKKPKSRPPLKYAHYDRCAVCGDIMSPKAKKLHRVKDGVYVHKGCYQVVVRSVIDQTAKAHEALDKHKEEEDAEGNDNTEAPSRAEAVEHDQRAGGDDSEGSTAAVDSDVEER